MVTTGDLRTDFEIRVNLPIDQTLKVVETALNNTHPKNLYVNREKFTLIGKTKFSWIKDTYGVEFFVVLSYTGEYNMTGVYMILSGAGGFGMNKPMTNTLIEPFLKELRKLSNYQIMIQPRINTITYDEINRFLETSPNNILNKLQNLLPTENSTRWALPKGFEQPIETKESTIETFFNGLLQESDLSNNFSRLSWQNAEDLVGKLFEKKGFFVKVTQRSGDFGIDVEAKSDREYLGIQVKHWNYDVGVDDVIKTLGASNKFNRVIIVSTKSGFTRQAQEFANEDVNRYRIELWDSSRFKQELRQYVLRQ